MPANTPNRNLPYPLTSDVIKTPGGVELDMRNLAMAVDADSEAISDRVTAEQAARITGDTNLTNTVALQRPEAYVQGVHYTQKLLFEAGYVEATLDGFAVHVLHFSTAFVAPPVVIVTAAASQQHVDIGVELATTTTANVFGRYLIDGSFAFFAVVAYYWMAIGARP
jgi:hypothetical protein